MSGRVDAPFEPGVIERVAAGLRFMVTGDRSLYEGWFGPGAPLVPVAPEGTAGRQMDYGANVNTRTQPRQGEPISFQTLRNVADGYDLLRLALETKKDQLVQTAWTVRPKDKAKKADDRCKKVQEFLECPDGINLWPQWFRASMEDLLVVDAWTLLPRRKRSGEPFALELMDGTTIKPVLGLDGRRPTEGPVYQQVLKGVVVGDFGPGQIYYLPQNVRTHKVFGYSRVEQIIATVNIALNRQLSQLSYYTEGSTPDSIVTAPEGWSMSQLKDFRSWWNDLLSGNLAERRKALVIPSGSTLINTKEAALKDEMDEWLARIVCYCLSVSPSQLIKEQNRGKDETQADAAKSEGTRPILNFVSKHLTRIVCADMFAAQDLEIVPVEEQAVQPFVQAQIDDLDIKSGLRDINECREGRGLPPLSPEELEARKPVPPPSFFGAPGAPGSPQESMGGGLPPKASPGQALPKKPAQKLRKAWRPKTVIRRDRPEMLKVEGKMALGVSKRLHKLGKAVIPRLVEAFGALGKDDDAERAKKISDLIEEGDFDALKTYLQDQGVDTFGKGVLAAAEQLQNQAEEAMVSHANERAIDWAQNHAGDLIKDFENATKADIEATVAQAMEEGWSNDHLAEVLEESWSFSATRAEVIARTETAFADVQGNVALYQEAGVQSLEWLAADTEPCEECEALDGKPVALNGDLPPLHPNCRCDVVPVINDSEEEA